MLTILSNPFMQFIFESLTSFIFILFTEENNTVSN